MALTWDIMPDLHLAQIDAGAGAVWGVDAFQEVYRFDPSLGQFVKFVQTPEIRLVRIAVGSAGVWGIDPYQHIYRFDPGAGQFVDVPGPRITDITVGSGVWCIDLVQQVYRFNFSAGSFWQIPDSLLVRIATCDHLSFPPSPGDEVVWGINGSQSIYKF